MSSIYGENIKLSIFGQSHGNAIGMTMDGIPAGLPVDTDALQKFLNHRAPGLHDFATPRKEADIPEFLSGIVDGYTCGAPIAAMIHNTNTRSADYSNLKNCPRPGHADYTAQIKYGGYQDAAGGGHFSGRLTAPLCIAGGLCKQWLEANGIRIAAHLSMCAGVDDGPDALDWVNPDLDRIRTDFPVINEEAGKKMRDAIAAVKADGDSTGGIIQCFVTGVPAGIGEPMFGGMESRIAQIVYGIPAVKGLEFGSGFMGSTLTGSHNNDAFCVSDGKIKTKQNNAGGILGGITTGMPLVFRVAVKPTPSISCPQETVNIQTGAECTVQINGRHDPCIAPRAVPVVEAAAALAIFDAMKEVLNYGFK